MEGHWSAEKPDRQGVRASGSTHNGYSLWLGRRIRQRPHCFPESKIPVSASGYHNDQEIGAIFGIAQQRGVLFKYPLMATNPTSTWCSWTLVKVTDGIIWRRPLTGLGVRALNPVMWIRVPPASPLSSLASYMLLYPNRKRETAQTRLSLGSNPRGSTKYGRVA